MVLHDLERIFEKRRTELYNLLKERKFTNEGNIEERMEKYESKSDFLQHFIEQFVKMDEPSYITKAEFQRKFKEWCKENRHREMSDRGLTQKMKAKGYEDEKKHFDWLHDGKGGQARIWVGIKWKE